MWSLSLFHYCKVFYVSSFLGIFSLSFIFCNLNVASCTLFDIYPVGILWPFWIHGLLSVHGHYYFKYFLCSILTFFFWCANYAYTSAFEVVPQLSDVLFFFFSFLAFFLFVFQFGKFLLSHLQAHWFIPIRAQPTNESVEGFLHLHYSVFLFLVFLRVPIS